MLIVHVALLLSETDKIRFEKPESQESNRRDIREKESKREKDLPSGCFLISASGKIGRCEGLSCCNLDAVWFGFVLYVRVI